MLPMHEGKGQTSSLPALETYADDTYGSLLQLALECSGSTSDAASEAARSDSARTRRCNPLTRACQGSLPRLSPASLRSLRPATLAAPKA